LFAVTYFTFWHNAFKVRPDLFHTYRKELFVCLRYLEDVVLKRNVFTLAGSATMLLDVVLKIVLLFNEKHRELKQSSVNIKVYKLIYQHLADLLQYVDQILIECSFDVEKKFTITEFCQNLRNTVKVLYELSDESWTDIICDSSKVVRPLVHDNTFDNAGSDSNSGDGNEHMKERLERNGFDTNDSMCIRTGASQSGTYDAELLPPPKPPYNPALLEVNLSKKDGDKFRSSDISVSPQTTDSGVYSSNNDDLSLDSSSNWSNATPNNVPPQPACEKLLPSTSDTTNEHDGSSNHQISEEVVDGKLVKTTKVVKKQMWKSTVVKQGESVISIDDELLKNPSLIQTLVAAGSGEVKTVESHSQLIRGSAFCEATADVVGGNKFPTQHLPLDDTPVGLNSSTITMSALKHDDRPISKYENTASASDSREETVNVSLRAMKVESNHETYSNKTFVNGNLTSESQLDRFDSNVIAAKQHNIYENGSIVDSTSSSVFAKGGGFYRGDSSGVSFRVSCTGGRKTSSSKRNIVSTYMQVFGSSNPSSESDFRSSALVTYERLRDRWQLNLDCGKRRGLPFDLRPAVHHPSSGSDDSLSSPDANRHHSGQSSVMLSPAELVVNDSQVYYKNMMDLIDLNDKLNLPLMAVSSAPEMKPIVLPRRQAISYVNLLDELEVPDHMIIVESNEKATELKGGPVDALIVCAASIGNNKVQPDTGFFLYSVSSNPSRIPDIRPK
uniref:RING-type domain-containing protein n=1 Tax=Soboliphyme baturini TaxID=241478 RepID=A0A183J2N6_9BILA